MITTVKGLIQPKDLGIVALQEYILLGLPGWGDNPFLDFNRPKVFDAVLTRLKDFKGAGGQTLVDAGGMLLGRDALMLRDIAASAGIHIVASTGLGSERDMPGHFVHTFSAEKAKPGRNRQTGLETSSSDWAFPADVLCDELTKGMVVPGMIRTSVKAGIVTAASSWDKVTPIEEMSLRGAAMAAKRAGVVLYIADGARHARQLLDMALDAGLEPGRIVIGHCDDGRAIDPARDKEIAEKGAYVAFDHVGWEDPSVPSALSDDQRIERVKAMVKAGLAEQVVLSCSAIGYAIDGPQPKHSFAYLLKEFVPRLKKAGVKDSVIDTILIENPKRILATKASQ